MYRGTPVIYVDYTDYDEIAHHSGPERAETLDALDGVDRAIATLDKASRRRAAAVPASSSCPTTARAWARRSCSATARPSRTSSRELMGGADDVQAATERVEEWGQLNAFLSEARPRQGRARATSPRDRPARAVHGRRRGARARPRTRRRPATAGAEETARLVACASGNLGLIYFPRLPAGSRSRQLDETYPGLVEALAEPSGHRAADGPLRDARLRRGRAARRATTSPTDSVEGDDPLAHYGGTRARGFLRLDGMANCPTWSISQPARPRPSEVAAFEELIGSHGGLGGPQTRPFILHPADWTLDETIVGAEAVYRQIRRWAERHLDHRFGKDGSAEPLPTPERPEAPAPVTADSALGG